MTEEIKCDLSKEVLDSMVQLRYITDYTDDGWVERNHEGWVPLSDILENLFESEKEIRSERGSF